MNLLENWSQVKEALLEGVSDRTRNVVDVCMENTRRQYLSEATTQAGIANTFNTILPMLRRVIPGTIATEIVGVQPMTGPVGQVYSLRYSYTSTIAVPTNAGYQVTAGDEVFGSYTNPAGGFSKMLSYYSGAADGAGFGAAAATAALEGAVGNELQLSVLRQTVTAGTRKLGARWTIEATQDLNSQHGLDVESEMTTALSAAIVSEIDREIIDNLLTLAGSTATYDMSGAFTGVPNYVGDRHAVLGVLINQQANEIGRKTRMGTGNFIVVSPTVVSLLQSASRSVFAPAVQGSFEGPNNTRLVGVLNGTIKVYSYVYWGDGHWSGFPTVAANAGNFEPVLIGYKGNNDTGTGYVYSPYIPLMATGPVIDPNTMNSVVSLMTRYGKSTFTATATSLGNSADFYAKINLLNLVFL